jgi:hypothetical protein
MGFLEAGSEDIGVGQGELHKYRSGFLTKTYSLPGGIELEETGCKIAGNSTSGNVAAFRSL